MEAKKKEWNKKKGKKWKKGQQNKREGRKGDRGGGGGKKIEWKTKTKELGSSV